MLGYDLLAAYRKTHYKVFADPAFTLYVGEHSPALAQRLNQAVQPTAAFISACNPHSQLLGSAENSLRQKALASTLASGGWEFLHGIGEDPAQQWPGEASFLVLGISQEKAEALAHQFGQNAILFCTAEAIPELVVLV